MTRWAFFAVSVLIPTISLAGDRYVLQAAGPEVIMQNPCTDFMWLSDLYFLNTGSDPVTALPDNVSNGALVQAQPVLLPPNQVVQVPFVDSNWYPVPGGLGPFVLHFDLPDGVLIRSRMEPYGSSSPGPCSPFPGNALLIRGGLPIPVFSQLVPAGQAQYFLSTDLGSLNNTSYATIYNAAGVSANVLIEVRRYCGGDLISSSSLSVQANSALQVPASGDYSSNCSGDGLGRYITVTSDQPGLASSLSWTTTPSRRFPCASSVLTTDRHGDDSVSIQGPSRRRQRSCGKEIVDPGARILAANLRETRRGTISKGSKRLRALRIL